MAGDALTTGKNNVAIGHQALSAEDGHGYNVAVGTYALSMKDINEVKIHINDKVVSAVLETTYKTVENSREFVRKTNG